MRTTIRLNDDLLERAKREAARHGNTLTDFIREAVERHVDRLARPAASPVSLPAAGRGGTLPGVDLDDLAGLSQDLGSAL